MKRYRHYKRDRAIVLSCFGSIIEQEKYLHLQKIIDDEFEGVDIFISFSSRMVLKNLKKRGIEYKNLPQTLADVDMLGYRSIIVSSINLFPTDEHKVLKDIVDGFNNFSLANIRYTKAILTKTKETTLLLKDLNEQVSIDGVANLYIIHGTPALELGGIESIRYSADLLEYLSDSNYSCSLEGAFPYYAIKDKLIADMREDGVERVQIIPMLLVSGNHYIKDMVEIKDELSQSFISTIADSITPSKGFNLIEMDSVKRIIIQNIKEEITKLG